MLGDLESAWSGGAGETPGDLTQGAASATTSTSIPGRPTLTLVSGTGDDAGSITITWEVSNGGSEITGYRLQVWDDANRVWVPEATLAADAESYKDEGLAPGTRYYYVLLAINSAGTGPWTRPPASAVTAASNPDTPVLTATRTERRDAIRLSWTTPDDNGKPITGYELQRWNSGDAEGNGGQGLLTPICSQMNVTVTEFVNTGLDAGTKYYYRIRALPQDRRRTQR